MSDIRYNSWLHRSGTGGVYQDSSGKVGIGSSVPGNALEIYGTSSSVQIEVNGTGRYRGFEIHEGGTRKAYFQHDATDNCALLNTAEADLKFYTGDTQRMQLDGSGRLMIGNTAAASLFSVANNLVVGSGSGSEGMTIYSDSTNDGYIVFADGASDPAYRMGQIIYSHNSNKMQFRTNGNTDRLIIDNAGNVNISGVTTAKAFVPSAGQLSNRNLVINGAMRVAQRGDTTGVQDGYGGCDRFKFIGNSAARATLKQGGSGVSPTSQGFSYCQHVDCTTADASLAANDYHYLGYTFEGQDLQQLKKGTANAESITLSFWVSSPKTGTHILQLYDNDNSRHICKSYTVSSADTWEYKTLTFAGDTTGALGNDVNYSLRIYWWLLGGSNFTSGTLATSWASFTAANAAVGQVNVLDSTSNDFKLTGVQLEVGEYATPFEHRSYTEYLRACQRYFWGWINPTTKIGFANAMQRTSDMFMCNLRHPVEMRTSPTLATSTDTGDFSAIWVNSGGDINSSGITTPGGTYDRTFTYPIAGTLDSGSYGSAAVGVTIENDGSLTFSAEL